MNSFIGVMGITKKEETEEILDTGFFDQERKLIAGVLVNEDMLGKRTPFLKGRFPKSFEQIPEIFCYDERIWNVVKCYWENRSIFNKLSLLLDKVGEDNIDGIILPSWPHLGDVARFKFEYPDIQVFLSVTRETVNKKEDIHRLKKELPKYIDSESIEGILLDCNYYEFPEVDPLYTRDCLEYLITHYNHLHLGVEGVKDLKELSKLKDALSPVPGIVIVAENGLRDKEDYLLLNSTREFIKKTMTRR